MARDRYVCLGLSKLPSALENMTKEPCALSDEGAQDTLVAFFTQVAAQEWFSDGPPSRIRA